MWGRGLRGNNAACWALTPLSVTSPATYKQIEPFWCWFPVWVCVRSRTPWVSPTNSPVRLWVSLAAATLTGFFIQWFWGFISLHWTLGFCSLSHSPIVPPSLSAHECGTLGPPAAALPVRPLRLAAHLHPSYQSGWMCLFNSLVVGLSYSSIFCQLWLFLNSCCPSFGCARRHSVSTYSSIFAGSLLFLCMVDITVCMCVCVYIYTSVSIHSLMNTGCFFFGYCK